MILCASSSYAQSVLVEDSPGQETLVSASSPSYLLESKQNLQTSLVNLEAVNFPAMHTENGRTGIASI